MNSKRNTEEHSLVAVKQGADRRCLGSQDAEYPGTLLIFRRHERVIE